MDLFQKLLIMLLVLVFIHIYLPNIISNSDAVTKIVAIPSEFHTLLDDWIIFQTPVLSTVAKLLEYIWSIFDKFWSI
jgi:hypothetical protein